MREGLKVCGNFSDTMNAMYLNTQKKHELPLSLLGMVKISKIWQR